ncbi:hypothetical protein BN871_KG_00070 [Paenibacillus sp. P22]|nr:hypothetical protein BN871_KG_00070 [Paenibacillus sp. P22]
MPKSISVNSLPKFSNVKDSGHRVGGMRLISPSVLKEESSIQMNGKIIATPNTVSTMPAAHCCSLSRERPVGAADCACLGVKDMTVSLLFLGLLPLESQLEQGDGNNDEEEHERSGGGIAEVAELEAVLVNEQRRGYGAVERPALGHDERLFEKLQPADHRRHADEEDGEAHHRNRDPGQLLPVAGAVQLRRLVVRAVDALQRRDEDDHVEADAAPQRQQDERQLGDRRIGQPSHLVESERRQDVIEEADARIVQIAPDDGHGHDVRHGRQVIDDPEYLERARAPEVDQQGGSERAGDDERHADDDVEQRVAQRQQEDGIAQHIGVILQADELDAGVVGQPRQVHVGQADVDRDKNGQQGEHG